MYFDEKNMALITDARDSAKQILRINRAPSTTKSYLQTYRRLTVANQTPAEYCQALATSKGVFYTTKAAYQYGLATDLLVAVHEWFESKNLPKIQTPVFVRIKELYAKLNACAPDYNKSRQHQDIRRGWDPVRKKRSKRQVLGGLPRNWRELVIEAAKPQHRIAITLLAASGCRPAELAKGIRVARIADGIIIMIQGVKVTRHAGQPHRAISLNPKENPFARILFEQLQRVDEIKVITNRWTLFDAVKAAVKRAGISRRILITPYCFRHQFAADVKAEGFCAAEVLGHATDRTQSNYGHSSQAKGRSGIKATQVTRPIRPTEGRGARQYEHLGPRMR